jgi:hypothetical protein
LLKGVHYLQRTWCKVLSLITCYHLLHDRPITMMWLVVALGDHDPVSKRCRVSFLKEGPPRDLPLGCHILTASWAATRPSGFLPEANAASWVVYGVEEQGFFLLAHTPGRCSLRSQLQNNCMDRIALQGGSEKIRRFVKFRGALRHVLMWCAQRYWDSFF